MDADFARYAMYLFAGVTGIIIAESVYLMMATNSGKRRAINRRMRLSDNSVTQKEVLYQLRKERGLDGDREATSMMRILSRLRLQANMKMPLVRFAAITTTISVAFGLFLGFWFDMMVVGLLIAIVLMVAMPIMVLRFRRNRRHKLFGAQLPEALDLITRGLKAGHPVPIALSMVAREMPDPIGTEFGMMSDEITYGSTMIAALEGLNERVGHEDLPLFVTAVAIQNTTGGNLREILDGLSQVIRERQKLRRKVRAISVEGRMSAYILSAVPVLLVLALTFLVPEYYGSVMDEPLTWYLVAGSVGWALVGNMVMFKMASFKF